MLRYLRYFITSKRGDGMISSLLWIAVTAIVSGAIAYSVWSTIATQSGSLNSIITTTIH